jgi:hypothetical protein
MAEGAPLTKETIMFEPLIALGLFAAMVWVVAQAIFMLVRGDDCVDDTCRTGDSMIRCVAENYGARFAAVDTLGEEGLRRL